MRFRLKTLFFIICLLAIGSAATIQWIRRPVIARTKDGHEYAITGQSALFQCVRTNDAENLRRLLLIDKYDLDQTEMAGGWTLLQQAIHHDCVETTAILLENGADPNLHHVKTPTPLEIAGRQLHAPALTQVLSEYGARAIIVAEHAAARSGI